MCGWHSWASVASHHPSAVYAAEHCGPNHCMSLSPGRESYHSYQGKVSQNKKINKRDNNNYRPIIDRPTGKNPGTPEDQSTPATAVLSSGYVCVSTFVCVCVRAVCTNVRLLFAPGPITMMLRYWV